MTRTAAILMLVSLAGCAGLDLAPRPSAARLGAEVLTVTMTDGRICRANWAASGATGAMPDCDVTYAVTTEAKPNILRQMTEGLAKALGAEGAQPPMGLVVLTDAAGRESRFASPVPVAE